MSEINKCDRKLLVNGTRRLQFGTVFQVTAFLLLICTVCIEDASSRKHPHRQRNKWRDVTQRNTHDGHSPPSTYLENEEVAYRPPRLRHWILPQPGRLRRSNGNREPQFEYTEYLTNVDENVPNGTAVLTVTAIDDDVDENGIILYELKDTNDFRIDSGGVIYTINRLDYESTAGGTYRFSVIARNPIPESRGDRVPVTLQLRDNEEEPHFDSSYYVFNISEFSRRGDYVGTVVAMDDDDNFERYSLSAVNPTGTFAINPLNGIITVWNRDVNSGIYLHEFQAVASDTQGQSTSVPVIVNIIDENTNRPIFDNCSGYNDFPLTENQTAPAAVFTVTATDDDYGKNGFVRYFLLDTTASEFSIDEETGQLTVEVVLDREDQREFFLTVIAKDMGDAPLESSCSFTIDIEDVNDNPPVFDQQLYQQTVPADSQLDMIILRLTATDADVGPNAEITYSLQGSSSDIEYFDIGASSGYIKLRKQLDASMAGSKVFQLVGKVEDSGSPALSSLVDVLLEVVSPGDVPPSVVRQNPPFAFVSEDATQDTRIATICAKSNYDTNVVYMDFLNGNIPETNSEGTFDIRIPSDSSAAGCGVGETAGDIFLATINLNFEVIQSYTLTIQLMNDKNARSDYTLNIAVKDVNDMPPVLHQPYYQSVSENIGPTLVLTVVAIDKDVSPQYRELTYSFNDPPADVVDSFEIRTDSGELWTLKPLDRETLNQYRIPIQVSDGKHVREKQYLIIVNDQNDEAPVINHDDGIYAVRLNENVEVGKSTGINIVVDDPDILNEFSYQIVDGNSMEKFRIDSKTGTVYVGRALDYDDPINDRNFTMTVRVSDGRSSTSTDITIAVVNVNDIPPIFVPSIYNATVRENEECDREIAKVSAYDPDYPVEESNIIYSLNIEQQTNFSIDPNTGAIQLKGCLDREVAGRWGAHGYYIVYPYAYDDGINGLSAASAVVNVLIEDVNDNHPFIQSPGKTIVISENKDPSTVLPTTIQLNDVDSEEEGNACPCYLAFDPSTPSLIMETFSVTNATAVNQYLLRTLKELDREAHKIYNIPFVTTDNNGVRGVRYQTVEVGDENDSPMTDGESKITVYNYKSSFPDVLIGSVYVTDADDYDVSDKTFEVDSSTTEETKYYFQVDYNLGNITMIRGTPAANYTLVVKVSDNVRNEQATGLVYITVIDLPEKAVVQSGSFLIDNKTAVEIITQSSLDSYEGESIYDRLKVSLAEVYETTAENVDIFTLLEYRISDTFGTRVRFNVHGSSYYIASHLHGLLMQQREKVERDVGIRIPVVDDNLCLYEDFKDCNGTSCQQELLASSSEPLVVSADTSTMVGVFVTESYVCQCGDLFPTPKACPPESENYCYNDGSCSVSTDGFLYCTCPDAYNYGPRCELLTARLKGGYAWLEPLGACAEPTLKMTFQSDEASAVLLYNGPLVDPPRGEYPRDFLYIILNNWVLEVYLDLGSTTNKVSIELDGSPSEEYNLILSWSADSIDLDVPNCGRNTSYDPNACFKRISSPKSENSIINIGGPLQLGGLARMMSLAELGSYYGWDYDLPSVNFFTGCVSLLRYNNETYDLNATSYYKYFYRTCSEVTAPPTELKMSSESVFIIVGSLLLLLLLVLILLVLLRRRKKPSSYPDHLNEIVKETMGQTDLEGYGEKDMTQFDLKLLRVTPDGQLINGTADRQDLPDVTRLRPVKKAPIARLSEGLSIGSFITDNTKKIDKEHAEYDDVRHYCFEGDEMSIASLSSLGSGSDGEDGNYNYLDDWGPRFKRLAEMYGPQADEEVDSDYEFPLPINKTLPNRANTPKTSPTSPSGRSSTSASSAGAHSVTRAPPLQEGLSPSLPYTRLLPQEGVDGPRVIRGEYHEAVNPLGVYEPQGKESWC